MRPSYKESERENQELRAQLKEVQARIAALEAELSRGRRQAVPFSRDEKKPDSKRPGRHPGQGPFSWRKPPPEEEIQETIEVPLPRCPDCGGPLVDRATHEQIQIDLPETKPRVIRFITESGYCPNCKREGTGSPS